MRVPFQGFVGAAYKAASWKASAQRCVNLYAESDPEKGMVLYGTPGHSQIATVGAAPVLAAETTPSGLFIVTADGAYFATGYQNGALTGLTTLASVGSAYAVIAQGGDQVMFVNGNQGFAYNRTTGVFSTITDAAFPANPVSCAFLDGFFIVHGPDSDVFQWSDPFNPLVWPALDFASAENLNDKLQRAITLERELYLIGAQSTEIWASTGGTDVFDRIAGTYIPYGTVAPLSAATLGGSLMWLAQDANGGALVMQARGLQSSRISTHALEREIAGYLAIEGAWAFGYQQRGHLFYVLTFPTAGRTWVYDLSTQLWAERSSQVPDPTQLDQLAPISRVPSYWRPRCHAYFAGVNIVGDSRGPSLSLLSEDVYSENGVDIIRVRATPHLVDRDEERSISALEITFQPGVGNGSGVGPSDNPVAMLRMSRDGGQTFGPQRSVAIGRQGDYLTRALFNRLGRSRDFVAEVSISAQVPIAISGAFIDVNR